MNHGIPKSELDILLTWPAKNKQTTFFHSKSSPEIFLVVLKLFFSSFSYAQQIQFMLNSHIVNLVFKWFMLETSDFTEIPRIWYLTTKFQSFIMFTARFLANIQFKVYDLLFLHFFCFDYSLKVRSGWFFNMMNSRWKANYVINLFNAHNFLFCCSIS